MSNGKKGGQPGNDNAAKNKPWRDALNRAIAQGDPNRLRSIADKLIDMAAAGEIQAIKELGDRLDGKSTQNIGAEEGTVYKIVIGCEK